jgi:hypothetical protein
LVLAVAFFARQGIIQSFAADFEYGRYRMTFLVVILFVNLTESTFLRGEHSLWFLFLLSVISVRSQNERKMEETAVDKSETAAQEQDA